MRAAPRLYCGEVYRPGPVTDWKLGHTSARKYFTLGVVKGLKEVIMSPICGVKKEGAWGAVKGVGIGFLNM